MPGMPTKRSAEQSRSARALCRTPGSSLSSPGHRPSRTEEVTRVANSQSATTRETPSTARTGLRVGHDPRPSTGGSPMAATTRGSASPSCRSRSPRRNARVSAFLQADYLPTNAVIAPSRVLVRRPERSQRLRRRPRCPHASGTCPCREPPAALHRRAGCMWPGRESEQRH
jgi:hypothetical protein